MRVATWHTGERREMLSQTVEYALRAMIHLASLDPESAVNSQSISEKTKVPKGYLSKILRDLVVAALIRSQRGPSGGFTLARPASRISILDVINAVDPLLRINNCPLGDPEHTELCPLHSRLDDAIATIESRFGSTTLAEVVESTSHPGLRCRALLGPVETPAEDSATE